MLKIIPLSFSLIICCLCSLSQDLESTQRIKKAAEKWADSVYNNLSPEQRIGQLIVMRLSTIDSKTRKVTFYDSLVGEMIKKYNIGGLCLFQGGPSIQARMINTLQHQAKTPLLISIDAEWGLGMRMADSVASLPRQMMLGAVRDHHVVYEYARIIAAQCTRMGIQMNFAPVIDINNNPANPVINDRSFGENKERVTMLGRQYVNGLQDAGIMACVKHFPGHGDVSADSHYDLPVINKTKEQLDSLELYPFRQLANDGVSSAMIAHLFIPSLDSSKNRATSLSKNNVRGLLQGEIGFKGLCFTDALEMQGVKKFFSGGLASVEAIRAGNDLLLLPEDADAAVTSIMEAIKSGSISWQEIEEHCKKILRSKYEYGLHRIEPVNIENLVADLNASIGSMKRVIAEQAITLLNARDPDFFPLVEPYKDSAKRIAYVSIGLSPSNNLGQLLQKEMMADTFYFDPNPKSDSALTQLVSTLRPYEKVIIGIHNISRKPANNYGITNETLKAIASISHDIKTMTFLFGNPYAAKYFCPSTNLAVCYEDDEIIRETAFDLLTGKLPYKGILPVTVCDNFTSGRKVLIPQKRILSEAAQNKIDSIAYDAIEKKAMPGCVVLAARDSEIFYHKAFGNREYEKPTPVNTQTVYDVASITKIAATTLAVMKLFDEKKIKLKTRLSYYFPEWKHSDKSKISIEKLLLHEGGLPATIPFYKETMDSAGAFAPEAFSTDSGVYFPTPTAQGMFANKKWDKIIFEKIFGSKLQKPGKYLYSDIDFILLGRIVEKITGMPLDEYVSKEFYEPMKLNSIGFNLWKHIHEKKIAPTENDTLFRHQLLMGYVHDPGSAMMGGISGHAGLFSTAYDLYAIMQMLLNGGIYHQKKYLSKETIELFTAYQGHNGSRRGYGFDKPEKDNITRKEPYPSKRASAFTFGHLGFTGTCTWADPESKLVFVMLSNRVFPNNNDAFVKMGIRGKLLEAAYEAISEEK